MMAQNVKVAVRCRPMSSKEIDRGCQSITQISGSTIRLISNDGSKNKEFTFDNCYGPDSEQEQVYQDLGLNVVQKALEGFNGTIFAYGQTGSGKTHTMMGNVDSPGLIPRMNEQLFVLLASKLENMRQENDSSDVKVMVTASYLEIYNEDVKDLLNPSKSKVLKLRENRDQGVYVEDLCELIVKDSGELYRLMQQGNAVRKVAATNMNEQSSRSHSCFTIKVQIKTTSDIGGGVSREQLLMSKMNLVDLAGSERAAKTGATGATLKEGAKINLSLMTLGTVINALSGGAQHVPYRDSKLTYLLSESLGGNAATVMVAAISPADYNFDETLGTLQYANRAKSIENKVIKNENVNDRVIRQLKEEIEKLKQQLLSGGSMMGSPEDLEMKRKIEEMENEQRNAWEEKERLSRALEEERAANMNTVMSNVMQEFKEQKIAHMKNLRRLQLEHETITKKQSATKEKADQIKTKIMNSMKEYEALQAKYNDLRELEKDEKADKTAVTALTNDMATLLSTIEVDRQLWTALKESIKAYRGKMEQITELITDEQGKIVATKGVLDENDKLRQRIQTEEREKAKELIEQEIGAARAQLVQERELIKGTLEAEVQAELEQLRTELAHCKADLEIAQRDKRELDGRLEAMQAYSDELENRLSGAQADHEAAAAELDAQAKELEEKAALQMKLEEADRRIESLTLELSNMGGKMNQKDLDENKYLMFKTMMNAFEDERRNMEKSYKDLQGLLHQATRDIIYLSQQNEYLNSQLSYIIHYEPPIQPSRGHVQVQQSLNGFAKKASLDGHNNFLSNGHSQNSSMDDRPMLNGAVEPASGSLPPILSNGLKSPGKGQASRLRFFDDTANDSLQQAYQNPP